MGVDTPAAEVIRDGLRPVIGVLTSYDVDQLCAKNNLSFCDLLLPFSSLANEVALKDPTNQAVTHSARNLSIDFRDLRKDGFLLAFTVMPHVLSEAVRSTPEDSAASSTTALLGECTWYKSFRDGFLYWAEPAEHEFLRHYLACLLVVSTSHPDPLEQLTKLSQAQHNQQHGGMGQTSGAPAETVAGPAHAATPKWFLPNIFKYHVLVHDVSTGDDRRAEELYQTMKMAYGANACHLLRINSTQPTEATVADMPDPWRQCLERKYRGLHQGLRVARMHALAKAMAASAVDHSAIDASQIPSMNVSSVSADLNNEEQVNGGDLAATTENAGAASPAMIRYRSESIPHALSSNNLSGMNEAEEAEEGHFGGAGTGGDDVPRLPSVDEIHGRCLSASDRDRVRILVQELVGRGLVPFVERQMRVINEQVVARKGISKSFTSGVKKWFGGGGSSAVSTTIPTSVGTVPTSVTYTQESGEMQLRRLADLAFLFQNYQLAYQLYQTLKRDFGADQAWLYHAGALEMSALCVHLLGSQQSKPYPQHYMDNALTHLMNTCLKPVLATRAALLSIEILASMGLYSDAASQMIRMTSGDNDVCSALFLEQASRCFDRLKMQRKCALHLVLAGHRYSKGTHKLHSLRCYNLAVRVYADKGWRFAEDHIQYTIAHQTKTLGNAQDAVAGCARLLRDGSDQEPLQQAGFLRDYLTVVRDTKAPSLDLPEFPVPRIVTESLKVFYGGHPPASAQVIEDEHRDLFDQTDPEHLWTELEKASWLACSPNTAKLRVATLFKPVVDEGRTPDEHRRPTPANERFTVQTNIVNFLQVPIALCDVSVEYEPMESGKVTVETLDCLVLGAGEEKQLRLWLVPDSEVTSLSVTAIKLSLSPVGADNVPDKSLAVQGRLPLRLRGRRLNSNTQQRTAVVHAPDHRLQPTVTSQPWPLLSVELTARDGSPIDHLTCHCGEIRSLSLRLTNIAAVGVRSVCVVADPLDAVALTRRSATSGADNEELMETKVIDGHTVWTFPHDWNLAPAASSECTLWLRAPQKAGKSAVQLVVYYETESGSHRRHRQRIALTCDGLVDSRCRCSKSSSSSMPLLACVIVRNLNTAHDAVVAEVQLLRISCVSDGDDEYGSLAMDQIASNLKDLRLQPGELENLCFQLVSAERGDRRVSEQWLTAKLPENNRFGQLSPAITPWPHQGGRGTHLALLWKAHVVDRNGKSGFIFGEQWCPVTIPRTSGYEPALAVVQSPPATTEGAPALSFSLPSIDASLSESQSTVASVTCSAVVDRVLIAHDFHAERLCNVPVGLKLTNTSRAAPARVVLRCSNANIAELTAASRGHRGSQSALWLGRTTHSLTLEPGASRSLPLRVSACRPGVYDIANLRLESRLGDSDVPFLVSVPSIFITISDTRS